MPSKKQLDPLTLPTIHQRRLVAKSRLFQVEALELEFSNGSVREYERMRGGGRGAVMVVPVTHNQELILVREYAAGTERYELGFPKGIIDPGEDAHTAANRELQEEIGFAASELTELKSLTMAPGFSWC